MIYKLNNNQRSWDVMLQSRKTQKSKSGSRKLQFWLQMTRNKCTIRKYLESPCEWLRDVLVATEAEPVVSKGTGSNENVQVVKEI